MNILLISGSPRKNGNTELLVDEFVKGAKAAGHETEKICLREKKIAPCLACEACLRNGGTCVQKDDMAVRQTILSLPPLSTGGV